MLRILIANDADYAEGLLQHLKAMTKPQCDVTLIDNLDDMASRVAGIDVLILDNEFGTSMMAGLDTFSALREQLKNTRVLIYSAYSGIDLIKSAKHLGAMGYVLAGEVDSYATVVQNIVNIAKGRERNFENCSSDKVRDILNNSQKGRIEEVHIAIFRSLAAGKTVSDTAVELGRNQDWINNELARIAKEWGIRRAIPAIVTKAIIEGYIDVKTLSFEKQGKGKGN